MSEKVTRKRSPLKARMVKLIDAMDDEQLQALAPLLVARSLSDVVTTQTDAADVIRALGQSYGINVVMTHDE